MLVSVFGYASTVNTFKGQVDMPSALLFCTLHASPIRICRDTGGLTICFAILHPPTTFNVYVSSMNSAHGVPISVSVGYL